MLILSNRHTKEDLRLWAEYEQADRCHSVDLRRAVTLVKEFAQQPCYCSVSWGKDSVVIAAIVATETPHVPLVWVRPEGAECPGCDEVRDEFLQRYDVEYYEPVCPAEVWNDPKVSNTVAFKPAVEAAGTSRRIVGVRARESGNRKLSMRFHGMVTEQVCRPIGWMTEQDVFAIHAQEGLPTHPNYAMLGGGRWQRNKLRVDSVGGEWGSGMGRAAWEQEYYGDVLARMQVR